MLNKVSKRVKSLPKRRASVLIYNTLVFLLGDGDKEKAVKKFQSLKANCSSDEEFAEALKVEINYDFFNALYNLLDLNNISGIIRSIKNIKSQSSELKKLITNQKGIDRLIDDRNGLRSIVLNSVFSRKGEFLNDEQLKIILLKEFSISKELIADEFNVSKKLLNKWLKIETLFDREFEKTLASRTKQGVFLNEYMLIFETLFLAINEGKLDIQENLDSYIKRLNQKMNFSKEDIAEISDSDIKTQKGVLRKVAYYQFVDKFPYSLSKELVEKMGSELNY